MNHFRAIALSLPLLLAALVIATTTSAAVSAFMPGKPCGSVSGAAWKSVGYDGPRKFQRQSGTKYNVSALRAGTCAVAMKAVSALTKQKPYKSALGARTLTGPRGFQCLGTGTGQPTTSGFCGGKNGATFYWAPRLK